MKNILFLVLSVFTVAAFSQEKLQFVNTSELFEEAALASQKKDYTAALTFLDKISKNDSLYCNVMTSKSYYLLQNEEYDKVIELADIGIASKCYDDEDVFHINKAAALIRSEKYNEALTSIEASLKIFPYSTNLWYNKAIALEQLEQIEESVKAYEHTIKIDPLSAAAHLKLGNICYKQEKLAQAMMCFNMYMLLSDDINATFGTLKSLNSAVSLANTNSADPSITISSDDGSFEEINLILTQKVALNEKYDTRNKINVALVKQNHALFTWLKDYKGNDGFWDKKYVPFYKWVMDNDNFNLYTYYITQSIENESYKKIVKANEKDATEFAVIAIEKWLEIVSENERDYFYKESAVQALGKKEGDLISGPFEYYDVDGRFSVDAQFNKKGERDGSWKWYYNNGEVKEIITYKNGKSEGKNLLFFENGKKYIESNVKNDDFDGEYNAYSEDGALLEKKFYKNGKLDGSYESYFPLGSTIKEFDVPYKKGEVEGDAIEYYATGEIYLTTPFIQTKRNGVEKKYNTLNKLISEIGYKENELDGVYKRFYPNGNVWEEGASVGGYFNGPWKIYYPDSSINEDFTYNNGKIQGNYKNYNQDGTLHFEYEYKKDEIIEYTFYNRAGDVISNERKKGGEFFYTSYTPEGIKTSEGLYDISGGKTGNWKFYSPENGSLLSDGDYEENKNIGTYKDYYSNGQVKSIGHYEDDLLQGYYVDYYISGQMNNQGYYVDDKPQGTWLQYYKDGTQSNSYFYHNGELYGEQIEHSVEGKTAGITTYKQGKIQNEKIYDSNEKYFETIDYVSPGGSYTVTYNYPNGNPYIAVEYLNGIRHGNYSKYYYSGEKMLTGSYLSNIQHGEWTYFFEDGTVEAKTTYLLNEKMGDDIYNYKNGQINSKRTFQYDLREGDQTIYFEDGAVKTFTPYKRDKKHGKQINYSKSGKIQIFRFYDDDRLVGYSYMDKDGKELPMIPLINETGIVKSYYDNGKMSREMEYKNGNLEGEYNIFYYDGSLFYNSNYSADLLNGLNIEYYEDGTVKSETEYLFNDFHGSRKQYYENGALKEETNYKLDKKHGIASYYSKEKILQKKETYYNGAVTNVKKN